MVAKVIEAERPDALLPTLGGQTGLNVAMDLASGRVCWSARRRDDRRAAAEVIDKAEKRDLFKQAMENAGLEVCRGETISSLEEAREVLAEIGLPAVVRPSFTLGGSGSAIAYNREPISTTWCAGPRPVAGHAGADRRIGHRVERVRDGGDARRRRQRRDHLLDRKLRRHGRPHGRLDHGRPRPDADRQRVSANARRLDRGDPRDRRRDGRLEHPVRD